MIKELKRRFPNSNISAIDYDPGASEVNQLNRLKLLLSNAPKGAHPDETKLAINRMKLLSEADNTNPTRISQPAPEKVPTQKVDRKKDNILKQVNVNPPANKIIHNTSNMINASTSELQNQKGVRVHF